MHGRTGKMLQNSKEVEKLCALCFVTCKIHIRLSKQADLLPRLEKVSNTDSCGRQYIRSDTPGPDGKQQCLVTVRPAAVLRNIPQQSHCIWLYLANHKIQISFLKFSTRPTAAILTTGRHFNHDLVNSTRTFLVHFSAARS